MPPDSSRWNTRRDIVVYRRFHEGPASGVCFVMRNRKSLLSMGAALAVVAVAFAVPPTAASAAAPPPRLAPGKIDTKVLSAGAKLWFEGPKVGTERARAAQRLAFGSNVDANDPQGDLGAG